jgi:hypothetical protein
VAIPQLSGPQLHQAMITREGVEPAFEIAYFMFLQLNDQLLKYLHGGILAFLLVTQVFEANSINQMKIAVIKVAQYLKIRRLPVTEDQFLIGGSLTEGKSAKKHRPLFA